jgi:hydrogenase 3 maturation protease
MGSKKNILMGIGNTLRGDDGIGSIIARSFKDRDWLSMDCGVVPENFTSIIKKNRPDLVVLIDAVEMDLKSGEFRTISPDRIILQLI